MVSIERAVIIRAYLINNLDGDMPILLNWQDWSRLRVRRWQNRTREIWQSYNCKERKLWIHVSCYFFERLIKISFRSIFESITIILLSCLIFILCSCLFANAMYTEIEFSPPPTCLDSRNPRFLPHRRVSNTYLSK